MISKYPIIQVSKKNQYPRYPCIRISEKSGIHSSLVVKDYLAHAGDPKHKRNLLCRCIETCHLRKDLKYSRLLSEGAFFQTFEQSPLAVLIHFQLLYDHGHYQEIVDKFKKLTKVENASKMAIVMPALSRSLQTGC